jgi:hypothetical protein
MDRTTDHGRVAAETPGRVRIRLHRPHRHLVHGIKAHLADQAGIHGVTTSALTGSVLVHYDRHALTCRDVLEMCRDIGVIVSGVAEAESEAIPEMNPRTTGHSIDVALGDLDRRMSRAAGRTVNLRVVAPMALGALGIRHLVVDGLGSVSGYVLLLLAGDSLYRMSRRRRKSRHLVIGTGSEDRCHQQNLYAEATPTVPHGASTP